MTSLKYDFCDRFTELLVTVVDAVFVHQLGDLGPVILGVNKMVGSMDRFTHHGGEI